MKTPPLVLQTKNFRSALPWVFLLLLSAAFTYAQVNTGAIVGTVTDSSGAVVPNVGVTLTNQETGVTSEDHTNQSGAYAFRALLPGVYKVTLKAQGFETVEEINIPVQVSQINTRDVVLTVGQSKTAVTVSAPSVALETQSAALGEVIGETLVRDLPLNGRNFTQLLTLTAGTAAPSTAASWGNPQSGTYVLPSINGQNPQSTQFLLDGSNNTSNFAGGISVAPIIDNIQEFKIVSHSDSVDYGGVLGGYVDVVTKGGTNTFQGAAWEFLRNNDLDARNTFLPSVNPLHQNQFGGNFGGPIKKNRLFFFGSYQGLREHIGSTAFYLVPTPAMENGDFTGQQPIFNPYSTRPNPNNPGTYIRDPFMCDVQGNPLTPNAAGLQPSGTPCNKIPMQMLSPLALLYAKTLFPAPINTGVPGTNGIDPAPEVFNQDFYTGRGDYQITSNQFLSGTYNHINSSDTTSGGIAGSSFIRDSFGYNVAVNYTWTINPNTVFHASFGRTWINLHLASQWNNLNYDTFVEPNWPWACGRSEGFGKDSCWAPDMLIPGYASVNNFSTHVGQTDIWEGTPSLEHVAGNHTFKFGGNLTRHRIWADTQRAFDFFNSTQTADLNNVGTTGSAIASFFLGVPSGGNLTDTAPGLQQPTWTYGFYGQDQWRINKKLTFNYGLRWDLFNPGQYGTPGTSNYYSGIWDSLNGTYIISANPGACSTVGHAPCIPTPDGTLPPHVVIAPDHKIFHKVYDNFAPRIGLAYQLTPSTVLRAGIGRYYDTWSDTDLSVFQSEGLWPDNLAAQNTNLNLTTVQSTIANPLNISPGQKLLPDPNGPYDISGQTFRDPNLKDPWTDNWNVGIQHAFGSSAILSVNYVGSNGRRIPVALVLNSAVVAGPGNPTLRQPFPYYLPSGQTVDWGKDWYNALQVTMQHRFTNGLSYSIAYTWSKSEDLGSTDGLAGGIQNAYDLAADKAVTPYNLPQVFTASWVYDLPFGKARMLSSRSRLVNNVIAGWELSGIFQLTSGAPYGVYLCGDIANVGRTDCYERPNIVGNANLSKPTPQQWFNPSAFAVPAQYTYGNAGAYILQGDGFVNLDASLIRTFTLTERLKLQFRLDAFNSTNTVTYGNPINQLNLPGQTGVVTGTRSTERQLQLAGKFYF
jgi:outer membrane receptor protein involved in Fe transport